MFVAFATRRQCVVSLHVRCIGIAVLWSFCKTVEGNCPDSKAISQGGLTVSDIPLCQPTAKLNHTGIQLLHFHQSSTLTSSLILLDISYNEIEYIRTNTFVDMGLLVDLDLSNNQLIAINRNTFKGSVIEHLDLRNNRISLLVSGAFGGLEDTLVFLSIASNRLSELLPGVFDGLRLLVTIYLSSNQLTAIGQEDFTGLPRLRRLFLQENRLLVINGWPSSLEQFHLTNNNITSIKMVPQNSATKIYIEGNLLYCSCKNKNFGAWCLSSGNCSMNHNCTEWFYEAITLALHCNNTNIENTTDGGIQWPSRGHCFMNHNCTEWFYEAITLALHCNNTTIENTTGGIQSFSTGARKEEQYLSIFITFFVSLAYTLY